MYLINKIGRKKKYTKLNYFIHLGYGLTVSIYLPLHISIKP